MDNQQLPANSFKPAREANHLFRALSSPNYRLFFFGQCISLIGTWMQNVALSWLVYRLTGSGLMLGVASFSSQICSGFLSPFAGVLIDRIDRRKLLLITQAAFLLIAVLLTILVFAKAIAVWQVIAINILSGLVMAFDMPGRQSFMVDVVEKKSDLPNAIALNSTIFNMARLIGPAAAGLLIGIIGEGWCFGINAITYIAVLIALLLMRIKPYKKSASKMRIWKDFKEGFKYVGGNIAIKNVILLLAAVGFTGMTYIVLLPLFADNLPGGGSHAYGFLLSAVGAGALIGGYVLAARKSIIGLERGMLTAVLLLGAGLIAFSFSRTLWLSCIILVPVGFGMMMTMQGCNSIVQTLVDDHIRGRVMAIFVLAFSGFTPFGNLLAGAASDKVSPQLTCSIIGGLCVICAVVYSFKLPEISAFIRKKATDN